MSPEGWGRLPFSAGFGCPDPGLLDVPQRAGGLAHLLLDEGLLEQVEALAAVLDGMVDGVESPFNGRGPNARETGVGQSVVHLALELEWDEMLGREGPGPLRKLSVGTGQLEVHGATLPDSYPVRVVSSTPNGVRPSGPSPASERRRPARECGLHHLASSDCAPRLTTHSSFGP